MNLYLYDGPVAVFGTTVKRRWKASTYAVSDKKAKSNLMYKYKRLNSLVPTAKIELPGEIIMAKEDV